MKELQLNIISPEKKLFSGTVSSVTIPGIAGNFGVYPDHAPLVSPLAAGVIIYNKDGKESGIEIKGGIAEVIDGVVTICVDQATDK